MTTENNPPKQTEVLFYKKILKKKNLQEENLNKIIQLATEVSMKKLSSKARKYEERATKALANTEEKKRQGDIARLERWEAAHRELKKDHETYETACYIKMKYIEASAFAKTFPSSQDEAAKHPEQIEDVFKIENVFLNSKKALERFKTHGEKTRIISCISSGFIPLKEKISEMVDEKDSEERRTRALFSKFLEHALFPLKKAEAGKFFVFDKCELGGYMDIRMATGEKTVFFVEMKQEHVLLYDVLLRCAMYAYKHCIIGHRTSLNIVLVAVALPDYHARIGTLKLTLNRKNLQIKNSSLKIGETFHWGTEEGVKLLIAYILSSPRELTPPLRRRTPPRRKRKKNL
ncbi:MAG: uncharacterized protein A8A55_2957 [Amphiamblys sp. WSBS2006]|nr:MAG: uncharacterized protein A8A55_2957 [Amphiamblys sp. WSBS2006]